jgi:hypothetical protein
VDEITDIGLELVSRLEASIDDRVYKAIALKIRTKVLDARNDPDTAGRRWPFELIQNAHDAGAREGRVGIELLFSLADGVLRVEHDAAPFTMDEFAALLTGGSSKDFMSTETTGRFGTGFLVTHVLSERVNVSGILAIDEQHRAFVVDLYRPNDEALLLDNVKESQSSLLHTRLVEDLDDEPTATFEYVVDDGKIALAGLEALEHALPYLFATCRKLREITIQIDGQGTTWRRLQGPRISSAEGVRLIEFNVEREEDGESSDWRLIRAGLNLAARGRLVVALQKNADDWAVCKPGHLPSLFRQLPLLGSPQLPAWFVVDGEFEVEQERRSIHMTGEAARPLREAFAALGGLVRLAIREQWINGLRLAQLALPTGVTGESALKLWHELLSSVAADLSRLPLVRTARGNMVPCTDDTEHDLYADVLRRPEVGPSFEDLWDLAAECTEVDPPSWNVAEAWSEVAEGWETLGVKIPWIDLPGIGARATDGVDDVSELKVDDDPYEWLAAYFEAVGKSWKAGGTTKSHLSGLLPDQYGTLSDIDTLDRDGGVGDGVKSIADDVGLDLRARLLDEKLIEVLRRDGLTAGLYAVQQVTSEEFSEADAIDEVIAQLAAVLPDEQKITDKNKDAAEATIDLLTLLWSSRGKGAEQVAWRIPLLAADGTTRMASRRRLMLPPVGAWPEPARPFADAYPSGRVLAERYREAEDSLVEALAAWGMAHRGLLTVTAREILSDRALKTLATAPDEVADATLRETELSQIALLEPELINYCKQSRERARLLLGLVVSFVAGADPSWRVPVLLPVRTAAGERQVLLTPTLWLSDLRSKPWIPVEDGDDVTHHPANPELVRDLLDPGWLEDNSSGADLLVRHFGIDALDVRLLAAASDEEARQRLRDSLARIVEAVGDNSQVIEELAVKAQQHRRDVERMRKLGLAVQESVEVAMRARDLDVEDVDRGYDFYVTPVEVREDDPNDLSSHFEVAGYKVEVKATTTGEARLTPLQAATAADEPDVFVLCVVDLRNFDGDVHQVDWAAEDVSGRCKFMFGRDIPAGETLSFIQHAESSDVPIRNTTALRYAVPPDLWEQGQDIDDWVASAFPTSSD